MSWWEDCKRSRGWKGGRRERKRERIVDNHIRRGACESDLGKVSIIHNVFQWVSQYFPVDIIIPVDDDHDG